MRQLEAGLRQNASLCNSFMHPIPTHVLAYWRGVQEKAVAGAEAAIAEMEQEDRVIDAAMGLCARTACRAPGAICRHTHYPHRMYCLRCARLINGQPGQAGLVEIPPLEVREAEREKRRALNAAVCAQLADVEEQDSGQSLPGYRRA